MRIKQFAAALLLLVLQILNLQIANAQELTREQAQTYVEPPYSLGEEFAEGSWELINLDGRVAGFGFATAPRAPLPGFSGAPINLFVQITNDGKFIDVDLFAHNEPIFVSGLGQAPFHEFVTQYKGYSITDTLVVGVPYGDHAGGSSLIYLDGVTKATASVRIAHESILAAAFQVAREKLSGLGSSSPAAPDLSIVEDLTWNDLVEQEIATHHTMTNAEVDALFKGTLWADDDPEAKDAPDDLYLDLWIVDLGPPAVASAVLQDSTLDELNRFREISPNDEPILLIERARHGLVDENFIRNTSPDLLSAKQGGLPIALRDADLFIDLKQDVPEGTAMILRTDRRLGFNPIAEWTLLVRAKRNHGIFQPEIGTADLEAKHSAPARFFIETKPPAPPPVWLQAMQQRKADLIALALLVVPLIILFAFRLQTLAAAPWFAPFRLTYLALVTGFIGWWGQGQLSIATPLGVIRALAENKPLDFLLYDPFSLGLWIAVILSFVFWGRAIFCGWLCPFGALQEFTGKIGRALKLPDLTPPPAIDRILVNAKYVVLSAMVIALFAKPELNDRLIEIEPFKTAITTYFDREWYFIAYAAGLLVLSAFIYKGFCRYLCPLGAFMAIGGFLRLPDWIKRRAECGSPCQLCKVKCPYNAIKANGEIQYSECFGCLDCVTIYEDKNRCVPEVLAKKGRTLKAFTTEQPA